MHPITIIVDLAIAQKTPRCATTERNLAKSGEAARNLLLQASKPTEASKVRRSKARRSPYMTEQTGQPVVVGVCLLSYCGSATLPRTQSHAL